MKNWGRFTCCFLLLGATAGCPWVADHNNDDEEEINVAAYADLRGEWDYTDDLHDNSKTLTYQGLQTIGSRSVHVLQGDDGNDLYFAEHLSDKLTLVGTSDDGFYSEGLPLLRQSFDPGKYYGPYETDDSDCRVFVTYDSASADVPYDYYDRVILTTAITECRGVIPTTNVEKYWFAKDEGLVKWLDKDGDLWELDDRR